MRDPSEDLRLQMGSEGVKQSLTVTSMTRPICALNVMVKIFKSVLKCTGKGSVIKPKSELY